MSVLTRFRLDGGTNQQAARKLLPAEGLLRRVQNLRLRRDGELGARPAFTTLGASVYGQDADTFAAQDLFSYDDRLFALGELSSAVGLLAFAEYVNVEKAWRLIERDVPDVTQVRHLPIAYRQAVNGPLAVAVGSESIAAYDGIVATVANLGGLLFSIVADGETGATLVSQLTAIEPSSALLIATAGGKFHAIGQSGADFCAISFTPRTSEQWTTTTALMASATPSHAAVGAVLGSPGGYVIAVQSGSDVVVRAYNDSHMQQMTVTLSSLTVSYLAIAANGPRDVIALVYLKTSDSKYYSRALKLSDGSSVRGEVNLNSNTTSGFASVAFSGINSVVYYFALHLTSTSQTVLGTGNAAAGGGFATVSTWQDAQLASEIIVRAPLGEQVFARMYYGASLQTVHGVAELTNKRPCSFEDFGIAAVSPYASAGHLAGACVDAVTGTYYAAAEYLQGTSDQYAKFIAWEVGTGARRQSAIAGNCLFIAGGLPLVFDGQALVEINWGEAPAWFSVASDSSAGSVTSSAEYFLQAHWEWYDARGNVHRSCPSLVQDITTGASDKEITGSISGGHSLRSRAADTSSLATLDPGRFHQVAQFRTAALADKTPGENLIRETVRNVSGSGTFSVRNTLTFSTSDDNLRALGETAGTIYTQGQMAIPHQAPPPFGYCWQTNERLAIAGLPRGERWIQSKLHFPGEAIAFANADFYAGFQGSTDEEILAIGALSGSLTAFTRRSIALWYGEGPDDTGAGSFSFSGYLSREGGIKSWQSLVEGDDGLFFQREDDQICFLDKHGAVNWTVGQAVRDELASYPTVTAAVHVRREHALVFAVENEAGNAGELLAYDTRRKQWFVDDIHAIALTEWQGRLVYADSSGVVHYQNADLGTGTSPTGNFETFDFDFGTGLSWGEIINVGIVGTKDQDVTSGTLSITFDSGASYTDIGVWALNTAGGYADGGKLELKKAPPIRRCSRFGLKFTVTGGTDSEGIRVNEIVLETETAPGMARLPARDTQ